MLNYLKIYLEKNNTCLDFFWLSSVRELVSPKHKCLQAVILHLLLFTRAISFLLYFVMSILLMKIHLRTENSGGKAALPG